MPPDAKVRPPVSPAVALVTGAGRRLGASFALDLARRGWDLWIHYHHSEADALAVAERVEARGRRAWVVPVDLSVPGGAEGLVDALADHPPSLVVHSASLWTVDSAASATRETWESSHRLHVWSAIVLGRALADWTSPEAPGHLITLLDSRLRDKDPDHFSYAFAKRELAQVTRYLAAELAPGVRVNGLAPGLILKADGASPGPWARAGREATPLGRVGKPSELLKALRFLVENSYVTGQTIAVDGGRHLKGDLFGSL